MSKVQHFDFQKRFRFIVTSWTMLDLNPMSNILMFVSHLIGHFSCCRTSSDVSVQHWLSEVIGRLWEKPRPCKKFPENCGHFVLVSNIFPICQFCLWNMKEIVKAFHSNTFFSRYVSFYVISTYTILMDHIIVDGKSVDIWNSWILVCRHFPTLLMSCHRRSLEVFRRSSEGH